MIEEEEIKQSYMVNRQIIVFVKAMTIALICLFIIYNIFFFSMFIQISSDYRLINKYLHNPQYLESLREATEIIELRQERRNPIVRAAAATPSSTPRSCNNVFTVVEDTDTNTDKTLLCNPNYDLLLAKKMNVHSGPYIYSEQTLISRYDVETYYATVNDPTIRFFRNDDAQDEVSKSSTLNYNIETEGYCDTPPVVDMFSNTNTKDTYGFVGTGIKFYAFDNDFLKITFHINMGNLAYIYDNEEFTATDPLSNETLLNTKSDNVRGISPDNERFAGVDTIYSLAIVCEPIDTSVGTNCLNSPIYHNQYITNQVSANAINDDTTRPSGGTAGTKYDQNIVWMYESDNQTETVNYRTDYIVETKIITTYFTASGYGYIRCHPVLLNDVPNLVPPRSPYDDPTSYDPTCNFETCSKIWMPSSSSASDNCTQQTIEDTQNMYNPKENIQCGDSASVPGAIFWGTQCPSGSVNMCDNILTGIASNPGVAAGCRVANNNNLLMEGFSAEIELITTRRVPESLNLQQNVSISVGFGESDSIIKQYISNDSTKNWCNIKDKINIIPYPYD